MLLVRCFRKVRCVAHAGCEPACVYNQMYECGRGEEYVRIVVGGVLYFLPTPMGKKRVSLCMQDITGEKWEFYAVHFNI